MVKTRVASLNSTSHKPEPKTIGTAGDFVRSFTIKVHMGDRKSSEVAISFCGKVRIWTLIAETRPTRAFLGRPRRFPATAVSCRSGVSFQTQAAWRASPRHRPPE